MLKHEQVSNDIFRYIEEHDMNQGDRLPSLETLVNTFQVSKNTVIKALNNLETHGLIYQVRGSGIFVRGRRRKGYINLMELQGFNSVLREFSITSKVLELKVMKPTPEVMANLEVEADSDIYYVKRLRYIEGRVFCVEESYYNKTFVPFLNEQIASESVFTYLNTVLNLQISFLDHFLRINKLSPKNADYLNLKEGDPSAEIESIYYLSNGKPFDFSKIVYHYEESQFFIQGNSYYNLLSSK